LQSIDIPASVTTIGEGVFSNCSSLTSITVAGGSNFSSEDGVLFNGDKTTLLQYSAGKADISYTIPMSVKTLEPEAFYHCNNLQSVTIPTSVQTIKGYAFWECTSLIDITVNWATPPSINGNNVFFDITRSNIILHIPAEAPKTHTNQEAGQVSKPMSKKRRAPARHHSAPA
jgi:hypothetical protein